MSAIPTGFYFECDRRGFSCVATRTPYAEITGSTLMQARVILRNLGWHSGPAPKYTEGHRDYCPSCVVDLTKRGLL